MEWRGGPNLRDLSCLLRCSLLLKARLQNWHLYFFSGAEADDLRLMVGEAEPAAGRRVVDAEAAGIAEVEAEGVGFKEKMWWRGEDVECFGQGPDNRGRPARRD